MRPAFEKGGKLSFLYSTFDAFATFAFVPNTTAKSGTHVHDAIDLKRTMTVVIIALLPALLFGMWNIGYQHSLAVGGEQALWSLFWYGFLKMLPIIIVTYVVGLSIEFAFAQIRGHEVSEGILVTGMLIPMIIPITIPLWMVAIATAFAVIIGKEVFGGTGMNIFNPAILARVFIFFAYPSHMTGDKVWVALSKGDQLIDGFSGATPLANAATEGIAHLPSIADLFFGFIPGSTGETSKFAILLGAIVLIYTGIGSWKIMLSCVIGALGTGLLMNALALNPYMEIPAYYHLLMGGLAFGTVFMATDPVSSAQTETGKWIYGFLIGTLIILIRVFNPGYPEGMMAVLFMNAFAPLIDHYVVEANIKRRMKRVQSLKTA